MILSDQTIMKLLADRTLVISPLEERQIQPASVDIRLGSTFSIVEDLSTGVISLEAAASYKTIRTDTYILLPGQFVLATTMEYFELPDNLTALWRGEVPWGGWVCLSRTPAGWTRDLRARSPWSCSMPTAAPSN